MKFIEQYASLLGYSDINSWRERVFQLGNDLGYDNCLLAILPSGSSSKDADAAFLHSNYSAEWRNKYDEENMSVDDPTISHCVTKSTPLIWTPNIFVGHKQKEMYEEAAGHGLRSGVTLPIHCPNGELGMLCFVSDLKLDKKSPAEINETVPALTCLRDFIGETSLKFMHAFNREESPVSLTKRELECLKWSMSGKSSWDIARILACSEATINFHFTNIRSKFGASTRRQAIVKAIRLGIITS